MRAYSFRVYYYVKVFKCPTLRVACEIMTLSGYSKPVVNLSKKSFQRQFCSADPPILAPSYPAGVDTFSSAWPFPNFWEVLVGLAIAGPTEGAFTSVFEAASKAVRGNRELYRDAYLERKPIENTGNSWETKEFLDQIGVEGRVFTVTQPIFGWAEPRNVSDLIVGISAFGGAQGRVSIDPETVTDQFL